MRARISLVVLLTIAGVSPARAASFVITIKNTSTAMMAPGIFTLSPIISVGPAPNPGTMQYATYIYSKSDCTIVDQYCPAGSNFVCWFGNETTLMKRLGLTAGVDAWVPNPPSSLFGYKVFNPGDSATVTINAQPGQKLSYITKAGSFTTYVDQVVMMHASGNTGDLTVPLFDGNGYPLANVTFDLGGYTVSSSSPTDGTSPECANQCPASNGTTAGCYVAIGSTATGPLLPGQDKLPILVSAWSWQAPSMYTTDAMALGDVDSGVAGNELVVPMEGGAASMTGMGVGHAAVLNIANGALLSTYNGRNPGKDFLGFTMIENLNNPVAGSSHFLVSEFAQATPTPGAAVDMVQVSAAGVSSLLRSSTGWGYPGGWNMGPSAGDLRTDGTNTGNELLIADYNGDIAVLKRDTAAVLNSYNLFSSNADTIYGHAAIADVLGSNAGNEIIVYGGTTGKVYAFGTQTSATPLKLLWTSAAPTNAGYAFGSGPAVADLDGDGKPEIIVATGGAAGIYAYSPGMNGAPTACKYKWTTAANLGFDYSWSSPVVGDVTGDGKPDVVVMSSDSVLSVLTVPTAGAGCTEGGVALRWTVGNGGSAWFTPVLANLINTGTTTMQQNALEIVTANYNTVEVVDVQRSGAVMRWSDPSAQFYPSALIEKGSGAAPANIYVSGWANGRVQKLSTNANGGAALPVPTTDWISFMGSNLRTGVPH